MAHGVTTYSIVLGACAIAVYTDVRGYRIPNWLTIGLATLVLGLASFQGPVAFGLSFTILAAVFALGAGAFCFKMLGGGDVKLAAAAAAGVGYPDVLTFLLYTALAGAALAIIVAAMRGRLSAAISPLLYLYGGTVAAAPTGIRVPYAIAITAGVLAVGLFHTVTPLLRTTP